MVSNRGASFYALNIFLEEIEDEPLEIEPFTF
jgi:hypothetical protein